MDVSVQTLDELIRHSRDDGDLLEMIERALEDFEDYHRAIFRLEITRRMSSCGALDADRYRAEFSERDRVRTANHNAVLAQVNFLNRLAAAEGLEPFYGGVVSEQRPYRREVADAVLAFVRDVIERRA